MTRVDVTRRCVVLSAAALACGQALAQSAAPPLRIALIEGLSGAFANAGEAVFRNLLWAVERVNQRGGVRIGRRAPLELERYDSKGQIEEALALLRAAIDAGIGFIVQGNSSAAAAALIEAMNKHNEREPGAARAVPELLGGRPGADQRACSFWHFRFDAHADMRLAALIDGAARRHAR